MAGGGSVFLHREATEATCVLTQYRYVYIALCYWDCIHILRARLCRIMAMSKTHDKVRTCSDCAGHMCVSSRDKPTLRGDVRSQVVVYGCSLDSGLG